MGARGRWLQIQDTLPREKWCVFPTLCMGVACGYSDQRSVAEVTAILGLASERASSFCPFSQSSALPWKKSSHPRGETPRAPKEGRPAEFSPLSHHQGSGHAVRSAGPFSPDQLQAKYHKVTPVDVTWSRRISQPGFAPKSHPITRYKIKWLLFQAMSFESSFCCNDRYPTSFVFVPFLLVSHLWSS